MQKTAAGAETNGGAEAATNRPAHMSGGRSGGWASRKGSRGGAAFWGRQGQATRVFGHLVGAPKNPEKARTGDQAEEGLAGGADQQRRVAQGPPQRPPQPWQAADQLQVAVARLGEAQACVPVGNGRSVSV